MPAHVSESPAKKQSKWSQEEDSLIIELRGSGMKWEDISKKLPGRSAISCRLHYQNYLERRSEWDEERKNKLARLYERFKADMWAKVAEEMQIPWRAAEAMHWQLGETDMARRAGVVPFSLNSGTSDASSLMNQRQPQHGSMRGPSHAHSYSHGGTHSPFTPVASAPQSPYQRTINPRPAPPTRHIAAATRSASYGSIPHPVPVTLPAEHITLAGIRGNVGPGANGSGGPSMLPSLGEMVTPPQPYRMPAYATTSASGPTSDYYTASPLLGPKYPQLGHPPPLLPSPATAYLQGGPVTSPSALQRVPEERRTPPGQAGRVSPRRQSPRRRG